MNSLGTGIPQYGTACFDHCLNIYLKYGCKINSNTFQVILTLEPFTHDMLTFKGITSSVKTSGFLSSVMQEVELRELRNRLAFGLSDVIHCPK